MEFIDGANLADLLAQGRLNMEVTLRILKSAADALDYAHSKGVVHRDIKPGNLLLEPSGKVKIADFGIAKLNQAGVTKTTSAVGSPAYMSPEHVRAQSIDGRADQYSLGVVAYEMITGRRPHDSEELTSLVFKVVFEAPDLSLLDSHPRREQLLPVFSKVLSKAADDRYTSCTEFCEALAEALGESTAKPVAAPPERPAHSATVAVKNAPTTAPVLPSVDSGSLGGEVKKGGNKGLMIGGGLALALALAAGGYFATRPNAPDTAGGQTSGGQTAGGQTAGGQTPGGDAKPTLPVLIQQPECVRPDDPAVAAVHGEVGLLYEVNEKGEVEKVEVKRSVHPVLDARAKECIQAWRFKPSTLNGKDVRSLKIGTDLAF